MLLFFSHAASPAPTDSIEQRVLACTACHRLQDYQGTDAYYPRIAGKPAGYLYNQLLNFREGRRHYSLMTYLVDHLSDSYLDEIAHHFSTVQAPYESPRPTNVSEPVLAQGRAMALFGDKARQLPACVSCHGQTLMGIEPAIPGLLGLRREYLAAQLGAWRSGVRRAHAPDCMADIAKRLQEPDIVALSAWLAFQPVPPGAKPEIQLPDLPLECGTAKGALK
ncbi:MAG TPA: cytochrome c4 [Burkholderiales bacterium]|nr:cytochrome c4 [Burkholderiales bacterium]